ncbi:hypothetical protein ARTHRO9V_160233 [Arthrobacter sp. 9V]|nr:hypothetical protein ARTHRO9V_160233 [Arthrobacter sp. 9V]
MDGLSKNENKLARMSKGFCVSLERTTV